MDSETILNKTKDLLEKSSKLTYVNNIFMGDRQQIYGDSYPCIVLETTSDRMSSILEGNIQENSFVIQIIPALLIRDREKALIGDKTNKGILDFIGDIKDTLYAEYPSLDNTCLHFSLSVPSIADFPDMIGKFAIVEMTVIYREII
jgi:hypothetical protein